MKNLRLWFKPHHASWTKQMDSVVPEALFTESTVTFTFTTGHERRTDYEFTLDQEQVLELLTGMLQAGRARRTAEYLEFLYDV